MNENELKQIIKFALHIIFIAVLFGLLILSTSCKSNRQIYLGDQEITMYANEEGVKYFMYKGSGLIKINGKKDITIEIYENDSLTLKKEFIFIKDSLQRFNYEQLKNPKK